MEFLPRVFYAPCLLVLCFIALDPVSFTRPFPTKTTTKDYNSKDSQFLPIIYFSPFFEGWGEDRVYQEVPSSLAVQCWDPKMWCCLLHINS